MTLFDIKRLAGKVYNVAADKSASEADRTEYLQRLAVEIMAAIETIQGDKEDETAFGPKGKDLQDFLNKANERQLILDGLGMRKPATKG